MSVRQPFVWRSRIRFVDTDATARIHYSSLFRHLETAEDEFFRSLGFSYSEVGQGELSYPRVHVEADYIAALRYDDEINITVSVAKVGTSSYTLEFSVYLEETSEVAAKGRVTAVCIARAKGRPHPLPAELRTALLGSA